MAEKTIAPPHKSFRGQCPEGNAVEAAFLKKAPPQTLPGKHYDPRNGGRKEKCSSPNAAWESAGPTAGSGDAPERHRLKRSGAADFRKLSGNHESALPTQTVEKPSESSRGSQPSRTFNRAQRRVRWARDDFCAENLIFQSKNRFLAVFAPGNLLDFSKNW